MRPLYNTTEHFIRAFAAVQCLEGDVVQDLYNIISRLVLKSR